MDVRQLERVIHQVAVRNPSPGLWLHTLHLQSLWELWDDVLSRVDHHSCREGEGCLGSAELKLQSIFAGGLEEDAGEELGAGLHLEPLLDLLALAREADHPSGGIDEASNKETGGGRLPRGIVAHLCIHLVDPHEIAALTVDTFRDSYVGAVQVLSGEDPDPVEVLVDQLQHLVVKGGWLGAGDGLWAGNLSTSPARRSGSPRRLPHLDLLPPASLLLLSDEPLAAGDRQREPQ